VLLVEAERLCSISPGEIVPRGGPSGAHGGRGGDVILVSDRTHEHLLKFRYNPEYRAERGGHGEGSNCHGRPAG